MKHLSVSIAAISLLLFSIALGACSNAPPPLPQTEVPPSPTIIQNVEVEQPSSSVGEATAEATLGVTATYDPGDAGAILEAGNINYANGNYINAINDYSLAILADPNYPDAHYNRGLAYLAFGDLEAALADFEEAISLDDTRPDVFVARARTYIQLDENQSALEDLEAAANLDPNFAPIYLVRAKLLGSFDEIGEEQLAFALTDLERYITLRPDEPDGYLERGRIYLKVEDYQAALTDFNVALSTAPDEAEAYYLRGLAYIAQGDEESAIADFEQARRLGLENELLLYNLGAAYNTTEAYEQGQQVLLEAVSYNPNNYATQYQLALSYFFTTQFATALNHANRAISLQQGSSEAYALRATIFLNLGRWQDAINDYDQAIAFDETYYDGYYGIAQGYIGLQEIAPAMEALEVYLERAPASSPNYAGAAALLLQLQTAVEEANSQLE